VEQLPIDAPMPRWSLLSSPAGTPPGKEPSWPDAGTSFENARPSCLVDLNPILPIKVTAAVVILDHHFEIGAVPPVYGVVIEEIEKL
jgi:hypothetical protein